MVFIVNFLSLFSSLFFISLVCVSVIRCQANEATCQAQLNKFPLVVQTPLLQRRVDDLNAKLKEIDAAKAMFSRPKVVERERGGELDSFPPS